MIGYPTVYLIYGVRLPASCLTDEIRTFIRSDNGPEGVGVWFPATGQDAVVGMNLGKVDPGVSEDLVSTGPVDFTAVSNIQRVTRMLADEELKVRSPKMWLLADYAKETGEPDAQKG